MPQNAAGTRMEPPVSVPMAKGTTPAATIAADPEDEPPAQRSADQGLRTMPNSGLRAPPMAHSVVASLATSTAPAPASRCSTRAVAPARWPAVRRDPARVGAPARSKRSLMLKGTPSSGRGVPPRQRRSDSAAAARAVSSSAYAVQFKARCARARRARACSTTVTGESPPCR